MMVQHIGKTGMYKIGEGSMGINDHGALCTVYINELLSFRKHCLFKFKNETRLQKTKQKNTAHNIGNCITPQSVLQLNYTESTDIFVQQTAEKKSLYWSLSCNLPIQHVIMWVRKV